MPLGKFVTGSACALGTAMLAMLLVRLGSSSQSVPEEVRRTPSSLTSLVRGINVHLPVRDYYGAVIPLGAKRVEFSSLCLNCSTERSELVLDPSYDRKIPLVLVYREEHALRQVSFRAPDNVYLVLESRARVVPGTVWQLSPISFAVDQDGRIREVASRRVLTFKNKGGTP
jgi:hypothetical protein